MKNNQLKKLVKVDINKVLEKLNNDEFLINEVDIYGYVEDKKHGIKKIRGLPGNKLVLQAYKSQFDVYYAMTTVFKDGYPYIVPVAKLNNETNKWEAVDKWKND